MFANLTGWHFLIILFVVLLLFGAPKLPGLAKSVGQSMKIFKKEVRDVTGGSDDTDDTTGSSQTESTSTDAAAAQPATAKPAAAEPATARPAQAASTQSAPAQPASAQSESRPTE